MSSNQLGIPEAPFAENVRDLLPPSTPLTIDSINGTLRSISELVSKYRAMESSLGEKRERALAKVADLQANVDAITLIAASASDDDSKVR